jgi:hypothetical protein
MSQAEAQVSQSNENAPEAPVFDYLRARLGAAHLLFENMVENFATEIAYMDKPLPHTKAEATKILGEIFNAFEVMFFFAENANESNRAVYIDELLRAIRDLAKTYVDLKRGTDLSDVVSSLREIKAELWNSCNKIVKLAALASYKS